MTDADDPNDWAQFPIISTQAALWELSGHMTQLPENGVGALVAWIMGPDRCRACQEHVPAPITRISVETANGETKAWSEPRSADDQEEIDEAINSCLDEAGVPTRPGGCQWYMVTHTPIDESDLSSAINAAFDDGPEPRDVLRLLRHEIRNLLGRFC